jgi:hypothetical protein
VLKVYANGVEVGNAVVDGTQWAITDLNGYTAGWTYTAKVINSSGVFGPMATQRVTNDVTESAPVITGIFDTAGASIVQVSSLTNALGSIKGTGTAGSTISLYDSTYTKLVGTALVDNSGQWSVDSVLNGLGGSSNFIAVQTDVNGNSNQAVWAVTVTRTEW